MRLLRLQLFDYRNFHRLDLTLGSGASVFVGGNTQGISALLNPVSVNYPYSADSVLTEVHDAIDTLTLGTLADDFSDANNLDESSCPTG